MTESTKTTRVATGAGGAAPEPSRASQEPAELPAATLLPGGVSPPSTTFPAPPASDTIDDIVDRWFHVTFPGSPVAQTTEQWNFLHSAKEELKKLLPR